MHIMIVIHSLRGGGAERVAVDLSAYWQRLGYRVSLVTQMPKKTDVYTVPEGVHRYVMGTAHDSGGGWRGAIANWRRVRRLRKLIKKHKPDCVLGMMTTASILSVMAANGLPCRVIVSEHTHPPMQKLPDAWLRLRRWAYPRAHAVVALTSGTGRWIQDHIPGSRVVIIPNAVRWPLQKQEPIIPVPDKADRFRLLAVGRLHPVKGFDLLIQAFTLLASYFPDWDLVILGEGDERAALQKQIDEANLTSRISLLGRVGNMDDWYKQADMYVLSSRAEGLSNTLLEAMASGLPVVAMDCDTGPREIIRDNIDGILVNPPENPDALAAHLSDLMARPLKRTALSRRAVDVRDRFSVPIVMAQWERLLPKIKKAEDNKATETQTTATDNN
ncbi:glycosyltransferase family 4 protein [Paenalcaligenes faecalis]|uniref:glycosyltransferase family 4 protein n=2 Tax=Paenalcaligenes TaxID=1100891 RepID=UPI003D9C740F